MSLVMGIEARANQQTPVGASRVCSSRPIQNQSPITEPRNVDVGNPSALVVESCLKIAEARTRRLGSADRKAGEVKANGLSGSTLAIGLGGSAQCFFFILLLLYLSSCEQPQLIENSQLNQHRIHETVQRASNASGLQINHPLSVKLVDRIELRELLRESTAATKQSDVLVARHHGYSAMGLSSGEAQDTHEHALLSQSVAGLYVREKKTLYIVSEHARSEKGGIYLDSFGALGHEVTLAHEVIHALQHMHYPEIFEPDKAVWQQQTDAAIALQAAIEGDASLWAAMSLGFLGTARDPKEVVAASRERGSGPLSDAPILVRERIEFPYTYGYQFAYHEGKKGLRSPPASTEQVIHVDSSERRAFLAIDLTNFATMIERIGCRVLFQDTMGELTLSLWLRSLDSTATQGVWDGWDGDRWIAAACDNSQEVAWLTSWDTEQDAHEFETAFTVVAVDLQRRANLKSPLAAERNGREVIVASGGLWPQVGQLKQLAKRARVTTRAELAAHFARVK